MGTGLANAAPTPLPAANNHDVSAPIDYHGPGRPGGPAPWRGDSHRGDFNGAPRETDPHPGDGARRHDRHGGVIPPPGGPWAGGPINYWGYQETPAGMGYQPMGLLLLRSLDPAVTVGLDAAQLFGTPYTSRVKLRMTISLCAVR